MLQLTRPRRPKVGLRLIHTITGAIILASLTVPGLPMMSDPGVAHAQDWSLKLSWTSPGDDGTVGTASQYDIRYSTDSITESNWAFATEVTGEPSPQVAGSTDSFYVTGLQANTLYYMAMKTRDEAFNWSGLSNVISKISLATDIKDDGGILAKDYYLNQNYPNPFNPGTTIECTLPATGRLSIAIYNMMGQEVALLVDNIVAAGTHQYTWSGRDTWGNPVASGTYFYRMISSKFSDSKRMTLLR